MRYGGVPSVAMRALPVPARRAGYRAAHALLRVYWRVARPHTRAVKCVVREGDAVLFVRHAYGDREAWELPGGGVRRGEEPRAAVAREAQEELGIALGDWRELGTVLARGYGKRTTITCFEGRPDGRAVVLDEGELREARWCPPGRPPEPLGRDARMVLRELLGVAS
jgi:8-oxo-dGTP pyrophosphatase MutT (NUDIX family)